MTDADINPMGLDGFEFVEFAAKDPAPLHALFTALGFAPIATHRSKKVTLYRQGDINFLINEERRSNASYFAEEHGPSACGMAFRVSVTRNTPTAARSSWAPNPLTSPPAPWSFACPPSRASAARRST